jgi:hypothetical protein
MRRGPNGYAAMSIAAIARHLRIGERMIVKGSCRLGRHDEILSAPVRLVVTRLYTNAECSLDIIEANEQS